MENAITDVLLHVDEQLDALARGRLEDGVRHQDGVVSAGFSGKNPHMMMVLFDSDRIRGTDILHQVQAQGLHAELIGL